MRCGSGPSLILRPEKVLFLVSFLVAGFGTILFAAERASEDPQGQISVLESELEKEKTRLKKAETEEKNLLTELAAIESEVAERKRFLEETKKRIYSIRNELSELQLGRAALQQDLHAREEELVDKLVHLYKYAIQGYMRMFATVRNVHQFSRRLRYVRALMRQDHEHLNYLGEKLLSLQHQAQALEKSIAKKETATTELTTQVEASKEQLEILVIRLMRGSMKPR
jgi:septal ring factor EnvC (AmiA/AmiB activator)